MSIQRYFSHPLSTMILLAGLGLLLASCSAFGPQEEPTPSPMPPSLAANPTYTVQRGEVLNELKVKGRIAPLNEQRLFFRSNGYVRQVYVRRNEAVKTGQVLADLEIGDLENQLAQAQINLETAQVELLAAQQVISDTLIEADSALTVEKLRLEAALYAQKMDDQLPQQIAVQIQREAVRMAELRLAKLQRGVDPRLVQAVEIAHLTITRLQTQIADSSIIAPFDGQVLALNIAQGDSVAAFNQTAMTLYDPTQLEVSVDLAPEQLKDMSEGMNVSIQQGNQSWEGIIRRLPFPYGSGEKSTSARISLVSSSDLALNALVDVQVALEKKTDVLWLPPAAIRNFEGRKFVVIQDGERQRRQNVVLGIQSKERVEIVEGLQEGQIIVSP